MCSRDLFLRVRDLFGAALFAVAVLFILLSLLSLYILLLLLLLVVPLRLSQVSERRKKAFEILGQLFLRVLRRQILVHRQQQGRHSHPRRYH